MNQPLPDLETQSAAAQAGKVDLVIFRAGTHRAMEGRDVSFTEADLDQIAASYEPSAHEAPLVLGHPKHNDPAWGWVKALKRVGQTLVASFSDVPDTIRDAVDAGRYKHLSAQFYVPGSSGNPKPNGLYLRHVGLLGARPPSVKGLGAVSFSDEGADTVSFAMAPDGKQTLWAMSALGRALAKFMRGQRDRVIAEKGLEAAEAALPNWQIEGAEEAVLTLQRAASEADRPYSFHEEDPKMNTPENDLAAQAAELARLRAENADLKAQTASFAESQAALAREQRAAQDLALVDKLIGEGRLLPGHKQDMVSFMGALDSEGVVSFGEGETRKESTPRAFFEDWLAGLPPQLSFGEQAGVGGDAKPLAAADAQTIAAKVTANIKAAAERGETLSYADAAAEFLNLHS